ncbi:sigma-70 family RNA polymerase sigma factor [Chitinophaga horti]|uniref:Sigma-70 family RNA polymerase sigma factor n=1 Tax=Chitinophaga horti TaxID=2920382 RepID=A0ABY6J840_9BACT|nr:sigma-70 family RNA polymerase sigma factor [Chitinophaga horti]UYQ95803.1 sigma-70 family RNA polymerase sigma factor [Chitinophaga horti]
MTTNHLNSESELLQRIAGGDEAAFATLFNTWYPLLSTLVLRVTRSEMLAEEVVQEVFLKIWMGRESLAYVTRFKPFLWVMAKHMAVDALRKAASRVAREQAFGQGLAQTEADQEPDYHTLIDEAVNRLPPQQQKVYLLARRDRLKQAEIAELLGISISTVKSYMQLSVNAITLYIKQKAGLGVAILSILKIFS